MEIGNKLKELRIGKGLTQEEPVKNFPFTQPSPWEKGGRPAAEKT